MKLLSLKLICFVNLFVLIQCFKSNKGIKATPPTWPDSYSVSGVLELPYAEIKEPFVAFYDKSKGLSRIDFYDSIVKTMTNGSELGVSYKVTPVTTEKSLNEMTCFKIPGDKNETISIQSILPDLTNFTHLSSNNESSKWQYIEMIGGRKNTYTFTTSQDEGDIIPVRYEMIGYNSLLGSHYDRYYVTYANFFIPTNKTFPDTQFTEVIKGLVCHEFNDTDSYINHRITMNPLSEYTDRNEDHVHQLFDQFKSQHNKKYVSDKEHESRKELFRQNLRFINSMNRAAVGYQLDVNHLADRSVKEISGLRGKKYSSVYNGGEEFATKIAANIPDTWDWRLYGAVTPVKDQAVCGSCWSFGTTGTVEGTNFVKTGKLLKLSEQELVDCSWGQGNNACDGGEDWRAYKWIMKHGLATTEQYGPYRGQNGKCLVASVNGTVNVSGYVNVTSNDPDALKTALTKYGPISVSIDASKKTLSFYSNGVYYEPTCANDLDGLDHSVLLVGYGVIDGKDYWLIKNSWSTYWGNDGYILMAQKDNNCGVMTIPTYPIIK